MVRADWTIVTAWQKVLLGIALCVPIPALSASGLALPLPTAVYRVAGAIVEGTEGLTRAFTGEDQETHVLAIRAAAAAPEGQAARVASRPGVESSRRPTRSPAPAARAAGTRTRSFGAAVTQRSPKAKSSGDVARAPSSPVSQTGADRSDKTAAPTATHAPAAATQSPQSQASATETRTDPSPSDVAPVSAPIPKPASSPLPSPPAPSPPPSPPPAPTQPGLLEPVTKPLQPVTSPVTHTIQPVTDALRPVTQPLDPVLKKTGLGGLLGRP